MSDLLKIFLIDPDPIFRLGLQVSLGKIPNFQVVGETETITAALPLLKELDLKGLEPQSVNLLIWEFVSEEASLESLQYFKAEYPSLPILILCSFLDVSFIQVIKAMGVNGYCHKGTAISDLVTVIERISASGEFWQEINEDASLPRLGLTEKINQRLSQLGLSGNNQINTNLQQVRSHLRSPGVNIWEKAILAGRQRELLAARWIINHTLPSFPKNTNPQVISPTNLQLQPVNSVAFNSLRGVQSVLFAECINHLQLSLENISETPLEIDILRVDKKTELLNLVLQKFAQLVDDLRVSQLEINQLSQMQERILLDLWQVTTVDFFGKFSRISLGDNSVEIATLLLQDQEIVKSQILQQIPLFHELLGYLIFPGDIYIDNSLYSSQSIEAKSHALNILENLLIQVANAVMQPLLNRLADLESIKQSFYNSQLISTRELERFRNDLSWKYRWQNYVTEAQAIFESRYDLFVITSRGITKTSIYASRKQELTQLRGIPLVVTLLLEFRDAIAPRLKSLVSLIGSAVVFVLTQVFGRGIGLIGRGILQGMGNASFPEDKKKRDPKSK
jgi:DNA-binding NarL/FixJ family response regulator